MSLKSIRYWKGVIRKAETRREWETSAMHFIGMLAMFPEKHEAPEDVANAARILFVAAPEEVVQDAIDYNRAFAREAHKINEESQRGIEDIESYLEFQANDELDPE